MTAALAVRTVPFRYARFDLDGRAMAPAVGAKENVEPRQVAGRDQAEEPASASG
jgi:hypothetical protein